MKTLHMTLGQNIGNVLLDIAQTNIRNGNPEKAIELYTDSFPGFTKDYVLELLRNNCVLIVSEDKVSVELTEDETERLSNKKNLIDWDAWITSKLNDLCNTVKALNSIRDEFGKCNRGNILDFDITKIVENHFGCELAKNVGVHHIAAKLIAGNGFANLRSNGENIWNELCEKVENGVGEEYQTALYFIVKYVDCIRILHKNYIQFISSCAFLLANKLAEKPHFFEFKIETILNKLTIFSNKSNGYHHPICDEKLSKYKEKLYNDISSTDFEKEFKKHGIIEKDIMDGYDAGWLSPDGKFYGDNGSTSSLIHLRIAEKLMPDVVNSDYELEKQGWIKIHGNEVYGVFGKYAECYCPTEIQIKMICAYIDKFYGGKFYNKPQIVSSTTPISTYRLLQMDKVKLSELFGDY